MHLTYDMRIGGTEMVIKNIIQGSASESLIHSIYCIEEPLGPWGQELQQNGIQITSCNRQPGFDTNLISAIRKHIKQHKIDVLHCHQYTPWIYGCIAAMFTSTKVIFTEHGRFYPDFGTWKRKLVNPILCKFTDAITSISAATKQALVVHENISSGRIEVIYNGIENVLVEGTNLSELRSELSIEDNDFVFGTIARLDPIKNHRLMLAAFAEVVKDINNCKLIIVGDGDERKNIETWIDELQLNGKVILTGYDPKPAKYLAMFDIYLLSSLSEGTSMTLLEAMSLGKASVVTDAGGNPEIIRNEYNGYVTPNDQVKPFALAMKALITDNNLKATFGKNAQTRFNQEFSLSQMCRQFKELYLTK